MPDSRHLHWNAEALWQELLPLLPGLSVEVVAQAELTNSRLTERARMAGGDRQAAVTAPGQLDGAQGGWRSPTPHGRRTDDAQPCLLVAEQQTHGRGRAGRLWQSSRGASLTFSLSLPFAPAEWSGLSLAVGAALAESLDPLATTAPKPRIGLKWPNDLWLLDAPSRGRKLGGILIETVAVGERRMCIVGVGLNVSPQPQVDMSSGFACLDELIPGITAPQALQRVALALAGALRRFEAEGLAPFLAAFQQRDLLFGQPVTTTLPGVPEGFAEGIDGSGALRVRQGDLHFLVSGEVSVRPAGTAGV